MSFRAFGRMIVAPAVVAVAVGVMLRRLGITAGILALVVFFAAQLLVDAQSKRQLGHARRRLEQRRKRARRR